MRTCLSLTFMLASLPSTGTTVSDAAISEDWLCGVGDGVGATALTLAGLAATAGGLDEEGRIDDGGTVSGSIRRATRFATMRSAGRLTAADETTAMMPQVILRM